MRFLVTGGAGFIGSHIVERLLKDGHYVRVLDNFSSGKPENLSFTIDHRLSTIDHKPSTIDYELIKGDIRSFDDCLIACSGVDAILHQAALRSVPESLDRPHDYNSVNIDGTVNMLRAAVNCNVKRFVFASSCAVYGDAATFPQKESAPCELISPYALTKLAGEYYCRIFSVNNGLETVALRYFNVFGPRQSLEDEYAIVIPKFIDCMLNGKQPPIHGTGKQSRDFTYVDNVVQANILAATVSANRKPQTANRTDAFHATCNVGTGTDHSILDLVATLNKIMGTSIKPVFTPPRQGDIFRALADISKIRSVLGYQPSVSFEEGLRKTVKYFEALRLAHAHIC